MAAEHVTADAIQKAYFEKFRQDRGIRTPLALDADRTLYAKLGLIVFPTTVIISKDGKLANVWCAMFAEQALRWYAGWRNGVAPPAAEWLV